MRDDKNKSTNVNLAILEFLEQTAYLTCFEKSKFEFHLPIVAILSNQVLFSKMIKPNFRSTENSKNIEY